MPKMTEINYQAELQSGRMKPSDVFKALTDRKEEPPLILDINLNKTKMKKIVFKEEDTIDVGSLTDYDIIGAEFKSSAVKCLLVKVQEDFYIWVGVGSNDYGGKVKFESIGEAVRNSKIKEMYTFENIGEFKNWLIK